MTYAHVTDGTINLERVSLPPSGRRVDTDQWVLNLPAADVATQEVCGWYAVNPGTRPPDDDTNTSDRTLTWTGSAVDETYTVRPWTADELNARRQSTDLTVAANQTRHDNSAFLALDTPTAEDLEDQIRSLSGQSSRSSVVVAPGTVRQVWSGSGVKYRVDTQVVDPADGLPYRCKQDHVSQPDWAPNATASLWQRVRQTREWEPRVWYGLAADARYERVWYDCIQPHESQTGWEPPNAPALWQPSDNQTGGKGKKGRR